ncbi:S1C family serine protease [Sediminibacterium sp. C3]|uniref:S1C family serine protease n=1 Tax=Sediminibacterium sp. C3 TaxID=1267211 RepID=UPI0003FEE4ED|nr:serine protease [Sediminibacterium sp. C3]
MDDILLLDAIERYLSGEMSAEERTYFENLRKTTPEIDQMVVEHNMFLHQIADYAANIQIKQTLHEVHQHLLERGDLNEGGALSSKGKVIQFWNKYKRVTAIAASVGGVIALFISGLAMYFSTSVNDPKLEQLGKDLEVVKKNQQAQGNIINEVTSKIPTNARLLSGGSGFLVDPKGYIVTNAHILKGTGAIVVNSKGAEFKSSIVLIDHDKDLAILKINDEEYEAVKTIPYSIQKTNSSLGEEIFTLGYPRNEIVYGMGYLSAKTGFNGDSLSYQIQISANPGNSGGPVFNKNGEVIGVLSTRQAQADGVAFAVKSKNIHSIIEDLKKSDTAFRKVKIPAKSTLKGVERKTQITKVEDCVFFVKAYTK